MINLELKKAILNFICDEQTVFGINNHTIQAFKEYIYTSEGDYLIGGKEVAQFITDAIKLIGEGQK